jgi:hypothetical protein
MIKPPAVQENPTPTRAEKERLNFYLSKALLETCWKKVREGTGMRVSTWTSSAYRTKIPSLSVTVAAQ